VGVRGLQRPAPNVQENLRHWDREVHKKEDIPYMGVECGSERFRAAGTLLVCPREL